MVIKQIGPRIRQGVYDALQACSKEERVSMSVLVEKAIKDLLEKKGYDLKNDSGN
jgi:hypothetical protein